MPNSSTVYINQSRYIRVILFFIIATSVSNIFRFDIIKTNEVLSEYPYWVKVFCSVLLEGSGVLIGALISLYFLKKYKSPQISLFGLSRSVSLLMALVAIIILTIIGIKMMSLLITIFMVLWLL